MPPLLPHGLIEPILDPGLPILMEMAIRYDTITLGGHDLIVTLDDVHKVEKKENTRDKQRIAGRRNKPGFVKGPSPNLGQS